MLCVVQKQFGGPAGSELQVNQLVDAANFRNRESLIANRYLRIASADEVASAEEVEEDEPVAAPAKAKKPMAARTRKSRK